MLYPSLRVNSGSWVLQSTCPYDGTSVAGSSMSSRTDSFSFPSGFWEQWPNWFYERYHNGNLIYRVDRLSNKSFTYSVSAGTSVRLVIGGCSSCLDERIYADDYLITLNGFYKDGSPVTLTKTVTLTGGTDYMPLGFSDQTDFWKSLGGITRATVRALNGSSKNGQLAIYARIFQVSVNLFGLITDTWPVQQPCAGCKRTQFRNKTRKQLG